MYTLSVAVWVYFIGVDMSKFIHIFLATESYITRVLDELQPKTWQVIENINTRQSNKYILIAEIKDSI